MKSEQQLTPEQIFEIADAVQDSLACRQADHDEVTEYILMFLEDIPGFELATEAERGKVVDEVIKFISPE